MMAERATHWQLCRDRLTLGPMPTLMGIVNVTPDSFSDGGRWFDPDRAIDHGLQLIEEGAAILDVGGESTRPYSNPVPAEEQLKRVLPVITGLVRQTRVPISIDTSSADVARAALAVGAQIINDVTGLEGDPQMLELARQTNAGVCVMHMQGTPQTMQDHPTYGDCVSEVLAYLDRRRQDLLDQGVERERICLDPGIGFGKSHDHNRLLLQSISRFLDLGCPVLVGHSRKGLIAHLIQSKTRDRDAGTLGISLFLALRGVQLLRVHEVQKTRDAFMTFGACVG